jgi:Calx-beta domain
MLNGDTTVEPNETFMVNLSGASGATILNSQGVGTITNDDSAGLPTLSISDFSVNEGNSGTTLANFTATLSAAAASTVTVNYATADATATAGSDYVAQSGTLTFTAGQISKTIAVVVNGDTSVEPNETFTVNLTSPVGATLADAQGVGTIVNDDAVVGAQPVAWTSLVGVTAAGNSLTDTAATGVNAGAASTQRITSGDGYVEFVASETTTDRLLGLSNGNTDASYPDVDFGIAIGGAPIQVYVFEKGVNRGSFGTYKTGDVFRVAVVGGVVKYSKNGVVFYSSTQARVYPLLVDTWLYTTGATLKSVVFLGQ